ncbi:MAG: 5-formyltetrahydrofolate cyclo-ligase [Phenylobacterium sp.]|nr:5-formyltetrahydrofolate cyclo-ligase [Phenylobacterium sp.]MBL8552920.1 5-formyltetrahydrofolate cyclo-ligase [Phenylobacterium sp.]
MISKDQLRSRMRVARRRLAAEAPDAALRLADYVPKALRAAAAYGLYHPIGSEIDPRGIRLSGEVALPVALARNAALVFRRYAPGDPLVADAFGILAPTGTAPEVAPDIVFTPVLAFDRRGGRLGQGAGCYDRTIAGLRARRPVTVVGVAYAGQELADVPMEAHDERLDAILTETGYIQVS